MNQAGLAVTHDEPHHNGVNVTRRRLVVTARGNDGHRDKRDQAFRLQN